MIQKFQYLSTAIYHPETGREKEVLKIWQEGPSKLIEQMGGRRVSLYFRPETNDYLETAHWSSVDEYLKYFNARGTRPWLDKINDISREPAIHEAYRVIQEKAA